MISRAALLWLVPVAVVGVWALSMMTPSASPRAAASVGDEPAVAVEAQPEPSHRPALPTPAAIPPVAPPSPPVAPAPALPADPEPEPEPPADVPPHANPSELFSAAFLDEERD